MEKQQRMKTTIDCEIRKRRIEIGEVLSIYGFSDIDICGIFHFIRKHLL